jgi:hypothetical protein
MPDPAPPEHPPPRASLSQVVVAVFWSFFGVRKRRDLERDAASIRPWQVVLVGVAMAAVFVVVLIVLARVVVGAAR